jgi:hypothetical protein
MEITTAEQLECCRLASQVAGRELLFPSASIVTTTATSDGASSR